MTAAPNNEPADAARYFHHVDDGRLQCDVCPRDCRLADGQRGLCFVRKREGDSMRLTTYGRSSGFCIDPIEKKPLNHFYPGSSVLSFGTAGCNLTCKFCQNWDISKSREMDRLADRASPQGLADAAVEHGAKSVAFTYNDPVIFIEYAIDVARACHEQDVRTVAVTAGYVQGQARRDFFAVMDAANIDLKAFDDAFYRKLATARLEPVLDTLRYLVHETSCWTEITTLLIPGHNDSDAELKALSRFVADELRPDVPVHFSAFHPDFRMRDVPRTPHHTLRRAVDIARQAGLTHVYTGNVHDRDGDTTSCGSCGSTLIVRDWYQLEQYRITPSGSCPDCDAPVAGCFDTQPGRFGRRRLPVAIGY